MEIQIDQFAEALRRASDWHKVNEDHDARVRVMSLQIGAALNLSPEELESLGVAAILHDIGRVGIDDAVISKTGKFTKSQYAAMREHSRIGFEIIDGILPVSICKGVLHHHERYNGTGYPDGLRGEAIPLYSRIITVADVWDALINDRPYRKALAFENALHIMNMQVEDFDPRVYAEFLKIIREQR